jgi:hypothetical protein
MSLRDKLKQRKAKEVSVIIDGDVFLVRGPGRVAKNKLLAKSQTKGELDPEQLEANLLAVCVLDPTTQEPVMPDPADWDIAADVAAPLVKACIEVCGLDADETKTMGKGLGENDS